jgi:hypothetical protein
MYQKRKEEFAFLLTLLPEGVCIWWLSSVVTDVAISMRVAMSG